MKTVVCYLSMCLLWPLSSYAETLPLSCLEQLTANPSPQDFACLRQHYAQPANLWPAPEVDPDINWQELGPLPEKAPEPAENPSSAAKIALGQQLFMDPKLSRSEQIACASCHEPDELFSDGRKVSFGHDRQAGRRNAHSLAVSGLLQTQFWDGRAQSLEEQALFPIEDPLEMAFSVDELLQRLNNDPDYRERFAQVFGPGSIKAVHLQQALASFQRSLLRVARATDFERFLNGRYDRLNDQQLHGLHLFRTRARCMNCHFGPAMSDSGFHNAGLAFYGREKQDLGRYEVTGNAEDVGRFRTPTLRLVSRTGPWSHNGLFTDLNGLLNVYNMGMFRPQPTAAQLNDPLFPKTDERFQALGLKRTELLALRAFLDSL